MTSAQHTQYPPLPLPFYYATLKLPDYKMATLKAKNILLCMCKTEKSQISHHINQSVL